VGQELSPLSLVSRIEEQLERKSSGSGPENREYGLRDPSRWPRNTLYPQKLALTSPRSGGSPGRYSSLAYSSHGVQFQFLVYLKAEKYSELIPIERTTPTKGLAARSAAVAGTDSNVNRECNGSLVVLPRSGDSPLAPGDDTLVNCLGN
jgi:hypothetical protein